MKIILLCLAILVPLTGESKAASLKNFFICNGVKSAADLDQADQELSKLKAGRATLDAAIANAGATKCTRKKPHAPAQQQLMDYSAAMNSVNGKVMAVAHSNALKGSKGEACKRELEDFLASTEKDQRALYENLEAHCQWGK